MLQKPEFSMVRRGSTVRVRQRTYISRMRGLGSVASRQCSLQLAEPDCGLLERADERRDLRCECELEGLVPRHRSSFVEDSAGSRLAEPGTGCAKVALAPGPEEREEGEGSAELLVVRVDGSLEADRFFVSSEAGGGEGETQDLYRLLHHVF